MTALDRKLLRDLWGIRSQAVAIALVIACGVAVFVMATSTLFSLTATREAYYQRYRFADVFTAIKRAPNSVRARLADIPGVQTVETRVVVDVNLDVPGMPEPAVGRIISLPRGGREPALNALHLRMGRMVESGRGEGRGEVVVGEAFAVAHALIPGDHVGAVINGRRETLTIVGIVLSPEFVYQIRAGDLLPDDKRFGVFWMSEEQLAPAFNMDGAFNDAVFRLAKGASEPEVIAAIDRILAPYGGLGAYGREDQVSHKLVNSEMHQLRTMSTVAPTIFLSVAGFLLNMVVARLVSTQREQIAALKAFGYTSGAVSRHYLKLVLALTFVGMAVGVALGTVLGRDLTELYTDFFRFPILVFALDPRSVLAAITLSSIAAVLGTMIAIRRAASLPPAEAMRPEPPADYRATLVERLGLQRFMAPETRMIVRHLERQPVRSLTSCFGIALACGVLVVGGHVLSAVDFVIDFQFFRAQRQHLTVSFIEPRAGSAIQELRAIDGVVVAEGFRALSVRIRAGGEGAGHQHRLFGVMGLPPVPRLFRLLDADGNPVTLPDSGLVVSQKLAEVLGIRPGATVTLEVLQESRPIREVTLAATIRDFSGTAGYMNIQAAQRLMGEGDSYSGAFIRADPAKANEVYRALKEMPGIGSVAIKAGLLETFRRTVAQNLLRMRAINLSFATIIAFGVVYNAARISLAERSRELATLRVIGFTRGEISRILLGELAVITITAMPMGIVVGYAMAWLSAANMQTETQRFPLVLTTSTFGFALAVVAVAAICSGLIVRRQLDRLDLVSVLKMKA